MGVGRNAGKSTFSLLFLSFFLVEVCSGLGGGGLVRGFGMLEQQKPEML